ncbi:MAG: hypothetical protein JWQ42_3754 [Edaphobacter sp.]|nr:hypothetical protein [Edaphobacter sp.]
MSLFNVITVQINSKSGVRVRSWVSILVMGSHFFIPSHSLAQQRQNESHATSTSVLLDKAKKLVISGNPEGALSVLQQAKLGSAYDSDIHAMKGICQTMLAKPLASAAEFDQAIALRPNYAPNYFSAGLALATFSNLEQALDRLSTALKLDPNLPGVRFNYALVLARAGHYAESEKQVDTELVNQGTRSKNSLELLHLKARDVYYQKKWQGTLNAYGRVLELTPDSAEAYAAMGEALYSLNRPQESLAALQKSVTLDPENGSAHALIGKLYQGANQQDQAIGEFEIAHRLAPNDREIVYRLYRLYNKSGNTAGAARLHHELETSFTDSNTQSDNERKAVILNNTGIELENKGDVLNALDHYDQAAKADVTNLIFQRNAALLLCKMGRVQEAIQRLRDILSVDEDDAGALQILAVARELAAGDLTKKGTLPKAQPTGF